MSVKRDRLQIGLDKLSETKSMVATMQEELVILQPQLVRTQAEVSSMMIEITRDKGTFSYICISAIYMYYMYS
jgi:dynein heavy chain